MAYSILEAVLGSTMSGNYHVMTSDHGTHSNNSETTMASDIREKQSRTMHALVVTEAGP